jgi:hypothetical protein
MMLVGGGEIMLDENTEDIHNCFNGLNPVPHQSDSPLRVIQIINNS